MLHGHVVDELLDEDGLAHAGAAEEAHLAAPCVGGQQVDDLNAGFQNLHGGTLVVEPGGLAVDAPMGGVLADGFPAVDGLAQHVEHPPQGDAAHRHGDGPARGLDLHAPPQALAAGEQHTADGVRVHVLADLHDPGVVLHRHQNLPDTGQRLKSGVHHRPGDLDYGSCIQRAVPPFFLWALAPAEISVISCVMALCRSRFN